MCQVIVLEINGFGIVYSHMLSKSLYQILQFSTIEKRYSALDVRYGLQYNAFANIRYFQYYTLLRYIQRNTNYTITMRKES